MASPQIEDGFTRVANELLEAIIAELFSGQEFRIIFTIVRRTFGWNKTEDCISLSQFADATGMTTKRCSQVINRLVGIRVISVIDKGGVRGTKKYKINKNYDEWTLLNKRHSQKNESVRKMARHSQKNGIVHSQKNESTKDTVKTLSKDTHLSVCASEIEDRFEAFWTLFPARDGKKAGRSKALALSLQLSPEDQALLITAAGNYAGSDRVQRGVGILDPANFIRRQDRETKTITEPWREWIEAIPEVYQPDYSWMIEFERNEAERREVARRIAAGELKVEPRPRIPAIETEAQYEEKKLAGKLPMLPVKAGV